MRRLPILICVLALFTIIPASGKIKKKLKVSSRAKTTAVSTSAKRDVAGADYPTMIRSGNRPVLFQPDSVIFAGYDKTCTADRESILIINHSDVGLTSAEFEITYLDMDGNMLHKRNVTLRNYIPSGETRKIDFRSWDSQQVFYYHKSPSPRRNAEPYKISITRKGFTIGQ